MSTEYPNPPPLPSSQPVPNPPRRSRSLLSRIKFRFPRRRRKRNPYKVGFEDLLTDSCSLPSISEHAEVTWLQLGEEGVLEAGEVGERENQESPGYISRDIEENVDEINSGEVVDEVDELLLKLKLCEVRRRYDDCPSPETPGQDSAYGTIDSPSSTRDIDMKNETTYQCPTLLSCKFEESEEGLDFISNESPDCTLTETDVILRGSAEVNITEENTERIIEEEVDSDSSLGEVYLHQESDEDESLSVSSLSVGEMQDMMELSTRIHVACDNIILAASVDDDFILGESETFKIESVAESVGSLNSETTEVSLITDEAGSTVKLEIPSNIDFLILEEDFILKPIELCSALGTKEPVYYQMIRPKTPNSRSNTPVGSQVMSRSRSVSPNIFREARLSATPTHSDPDQESDDDTQILLVDEIDAMQFKRATTPVGDNDHVPELDTSTVVFPHVQRPNFLMEQLLKVHTLFNKSADDYEERESRSVPADGFDSAGDEVSSSLTSSEDELSDRASLKTSSSTVRPTHECDFSETCSNLSLETIRTSRYSTIGSEISSLVDEDTRSVSDHSSILSERTQYHGNIAWADEEFIELPESLRTLWRDDSGFLDVIKFLGKWGRYSVIVEGTLDVGDNVWEDHIYFQSNSAGKFRGKGKEPRKREKSGDSSGSEIEPTDKKWHGKAFVFGPESAGSGGICDCEEVNEGTSDSLEEESSETVGECQVVDRLFEEYQNRRLLQFNSLQQKSLYCSSCRSFHIIEII